MLLNCLVHSKNPKIRLFAKLVDIMPHSEWEENANSTYKYLYSKIFQDKYRGRMHSFIKNEHEFVPLEQVTRYLKTAMKPLHYRMVCQRIKGDILKKTISLGKDTGFEETMVDIDVAILEIIQVSKVIKENNSKFLSLIFESADIDDNKVLEFFEFSFLYRQIEGTMDTILTEDIQNYLGDNIKGSLFILTKQAFISVCSIFGLFKIEKVSKFLEIRVDDLSSPSSSPKIINQCLAIISKTQSTILDVKAVPMEQSIVWKEALVSCQEELQKRLSSPHPTLESAPEDDIMFYLLRVRLIQMEVQSIHYEETLNRPDRPNSINYDDIN